MALCVLGRGVAGVGRGQVLLDVGGAVVVVLLVLNYGVVVAVVERGS